MTTDRIALEALIEKTPDADFLREMIAFAADRLMALEVDGLCGAGHGERNAERSNHRNGYRERALGDPSRRHYPADPQAPQGQLPAVLPGTAPHR